MKVYSVYFDRPHYGTSDTSLSTPSTMSPESLYSWGGSRTKTKQVVDIRPQLPGPLEETVLPGRQQQQQRRPEEAGKQMQKRNEKESQLLPPHNTLDPLETSKRQQQSLPMVASRHGDEGKDCTLLPCPNRTTSGSSV